MELEKEIPSPKSANVLLSTVSALASEVISPLKRLQQISTDNCEVQTIRYLFGY